MGERYICARGCVLLCAGSVPVGCSCPIHMDYWKLENLTNEGHAIRALRDHFHRKAQHGDDCVCACCNAVETLAARYDQERGR